MVEILNVLTFVMGDSVDIVVISIAVARSTEVTIVSSAIVENKADAVESTFVETVFPGKIVDCTSDRYFEIVVDLSGVLVID